MSSSFLGKPRLANAAGARQRDKSVRRDELLHLSEISRSSDQLRGRRGKIGRRTSTGLDRTRYRAAIGESALRTFNHSSITAELISTPRYGLDVVAMFA